MLTISSLVTIGGLLITILGVLIMSLVTITQELFSNDFIVLLDIFLEYFVSFLSY